MMFGIEALVLSLVLSVALCVHAVKTGRELYWLFIIMLFQPIGGVVYFIAVLLPELLRGPTARKAALAARETLDPGRVYREARAAVDDSPTVHNRMKLAAAAAELGRHDEAESLYREAAQGVHADDPALLLGRATALVELSRFADALPLLDAIWRQEDNGRSPHADLVLARAHEGLGRHEDADAAYQGAVARLPGLEGLARYAAFLARTGRRAEAELLLADLDARLKRANSHFRREGQAWRDLAAQALR